MLRNQEIEDQGNLILGLILREGLHVKDVSIS